MITLIKRLFCPHLLETRVLLAAIITMELTADKCTHCGRIKNKEWE